MNVIYSLTLLTLLSYSKSVLTVCKNYLGAYPADKELLWEVDGIGGLFQRTLIARKLQAMELKGKTESD